MINNPRTKNLIVLSVKLRSSADVINYLFPLNPSSLTINQASRVSATFTYGAKVFQNLGAGLKTISFEGHTGYRLNYQKYGLVNNTSTLSLSQHTDETTGKRHWLDLYSLIQLIKAENKFLPIYDDIGDTFSVENLDKIENIKITIPDQGITYDVLLQNDNFMRNREQPNLYKYKLDFIVVDESTPGSKQFIGVDTAPVDSTDELVKKIKAQGALLQKYKNELAAYPGISTAIKYYDIGVTAVNEAVSTGNFFITAANSTLNDLRRLERMTDAMNNIAKNISLVRNVIQQLKSFSNLQTAFYEPIIRFKDILSEMRLLSTSMTGSQKNLAFNVSLTQLASISAPITLAANKATVAQFSKDIRQLSRTGFPLPIDYVREIVTDGRAKINIVFKSSPSALGISDVKVFATNDFGNETNLVESFTDSGAILSTNFSTTGFFYNFLIEYNYTTFESIVQPKYKSIKKIIIDKGETIETIIKKYSSEESLASRTYLSEVAYLNNIEYPYVVTSDNENYNAYFGSYGYKIFSTNGEFTQYIYNIDTGIAAGQPLPLYESSASLLDDQKVFLLQQQEVIDQIKTGLKFFVLLFKEIYSNRCYAIFGITDSAASSIDLFSNEIKSYVICSLEKGRSYDIDSNSIFEILSPYTVTGDLIEYYGQTALFDSITDPSIGLFDKNRVVVEAIYSENVGSFTSVNSFPFTIADKTFLAGDSNNKNYVILTNFTLASSGAISGYSISAFSMYKVLSDGQEILLPSFASDFLPFAKAFTKEDTYKVDLDSRFDYLDDIHVSILPRPDLGPGPTGEEQGILDFKLINGLSNVKQAIKNRLECPQGGLILHLDYGLPNFLGKKNTLENMILLRYNLFSQLISDARVKSANNITIEDSGDSLKANSSIVLVNNDETIISTSI